MSQMRTPSETLSRLILNQLAGGEMRLLVLVVGVRKGLGGNVFKGDLSARVQSVLRGLVASNFVENHDGVYSLSPVLPHLG
jgi:hypothetical protein